MFHLRRAAVRVLASPSLRSIPRPARTAHVSLLPRSGGISRRSFSQIRPFLADERAPTTAEDTTVPAELEGESSVEHDLADATERASPAEQVETDASSSISGDVKVEEQTQSALDEAAGEAGVLAGSGRMPAAGESRRTAAPSQARSDPSPRILFVSNMPWDTTESMLEDEFSRFGRITNIRILTDTNGQSRGLAYVEFADREEADTALDKMHKSQFGGRTMFVKHHVPRNSSIEQTRLRDADRSPSKTLFIGNMSFDMSDKDLNDLFREIRNVLSVRVAIDRVSGQPRGFAHADFVDVDAARAAMAVLSEKVVYNRQLRVAFADVKPGKQREESL